MLITEDENQIIVEDVSNFDCVQIFECGQCFRYKKLRDNFYSIIAFGKEIFVSYKRENKIFSIENTTVEDFENIWENYFDLKTDYKKINEEISKIHPFLKKCAENFPGIRILRQDPWETMCSFIISQNNNIPRIKGIISKFCEIFGKNSSFPSAEIVSELTLSDLSPIKSGFRAKYILDAAKKVASNEISLEEIKSLNNERAREELMKIYGIGRKVADCILLFGYHRLDVLPVDVWIKKALEKYFPGKDLDFFGKYAGVAQQYLYHYVRSQN